MPRVRSGARERSGVNHEWTPIDTNQKAYRLMLEE